MACTYCHEDGHNVATCTEPRRCRGCGDPWHDLRTCGSVRRCGACDGIGHNIRTCAQVDAPDAVDDSYADDDDVPLPRGPRLTYLDGGGWHSVDVFRDEDENAALFRAVESLKTSQSFRPAFKRIVSAVHRASKYQVYVGRTGATLAHLLNRFRAHQENHRAAWILPVVRVATDRLRDDNWEGRAIRWTLNRHRAGVLCCNNDVADQRGGWPRTEESLIYVAACGTVALA